MIAHPVSAPDDVGWLTEAQMIEVDRVMIDELRIDLIQMMENAGRNLAQLVIDRFDPTTVTVLAASGGNGGGGLVAARHLANRGVDVSVTLGKPNGRFVGVPGHQLEILQHMGVPMATEPRRSDVAIDALVGYSLRGALRDRLAELAANIGATGECVVSLDTPSGLNVSEGSVPGAVVNADATVTLALPKVGLRGASQVGELYVADISVPPSVFDAMGVGPAPDFTSSSIIRIQAPNQTGTAGDLGSQ